MTERNTIQRIEQYGRQSTRRIFSNKCIDYANASIERKTARGEHDDISKWEVYRDFTAHAVMEVER